MPAADGGRRLWTRLTQVGSALAIAVGLFAVIIGGAPSDPAYPGQPVDHTRLLAVPIGLAAAACGAAGLALARRRRPAVAAGLGALSVALAAVAITRLTT